MPPKLIEKNLPPKLKSKPTFFPTSLKPKLIYQFETSAVVNKHPIGSTKLPNHIWIGAQYLTLEIGYGRLQ